MLLCTSCFKVHCGAIHKERHHISALHTLPQHNSDTGSLGSYFCHIVALANWRNAQFSKTKQILPNEFCFYCQNKDIIRHEALLKTGIILSYVYHRQFAHSCQTYLCYVGIWEQAYWTHTHFMFEVAVLNDTNDSCEQKWNNITCQAISNQEVHGNLQEAVCQHQEVYIVRLIRQMSLCSPFKGNKRTQPLATEP